MPRQLPLPLRAPDRMHFGNYVASPGVQAVRWMQGIARGDGEQALYLWGQAGSGKTHLLSAACRAAASHRREAVYLSLRDAVERMEPGILMGLEGLDLICLDQTASAGGLAAWEEGLLHLYNRALSTGTSLVFADRLPAAALPMRLPDLVSRLRGVLAVEAVHLDDAGCAEALTLRARERGFELGRDVTDYLMARCRRETHSLFAALDRLDEASLAAQRRVTVPFLRGILEGPART